MVVCGLKVTVLGGLGGFEGLGVVGVDGINGDDSVATEAIVLLLGSSWSYRNTDVIYCAKDCVPLSCIPFGNCSRPARLTFGLPESRDSSVESVHITTDASTQASPSSINNSSIDHTHTGAG